MLIDSEIAHWVLYLEQLRAKIAKKYVCNAHKLLNLRNVGDRVISQAETLSRTQIVKAGLPLTDKENKSIYNI